MSTESNKANKEKTREVVINSCYGGFGLSHEAMMEYAKLKGIELYGYINARTRNRIQNNGTPELSRYELYDPKHDKNEICVHYYSTKLLKTCSNKELNDNYFHPDLIRDDPDLVKVVRKLGKKANERCADLKIVEIPYDVEWVIEEYDGIEWVAEKHQTWS